MWNDKFFYEKSCFMEHKEWKLNLRPHNAIKIWIQNLKFKYLMESMTQCSFTKFSHPSFHDKDQAFSDINQTNAQRKYVGICILKSISFSMLYDHTPLSATSCLSHCYSSNLRWGHNEEGLSSNLVRCIARDSINFFCQKLAPNSRL